MRQRNDHEQQESLFLPLGIESTFDRVISIFCQHWGKFLSINAVAILLTYVLTATAGLILLMKLSTSAGVNNEAVKNDDAYEEYGSAYFQQKRLWLHPGLWTGLAIELTLYYMIVCVADGATIRAVAETYAGRVPKMCDCVRQAMKKIGSLMVACVVVGLLLFVPFGVGLCVLNQNDSGQVSIMAFALFFVVFAAYGIYVTVVTYLMYPAIIIEDQGGLTGIGRSLRLSDGQFWHKFCILLLFGIARAAVNALVTSLTRSDNGTVSSESGISIDLTFGSAGDGFLSIAFAILFASLGSIFQAVMYVDVRVKKEGYTLAMLCDDIGLDAEESNCYAKIKEGAGHGNGSQVASGN